MKSPLTSWRRSLAICFGLTLALSSAPLSADVWDNDPNNEDDGNGTDNEPLHGTVQVHDLAAQAAVADQDWYLVRSRPFASYEAVADGLHGQIDGISLDRVDNAGTVLTAGANAPGASFSESVRWANDTGVVVSDFVRANGAGTVCGGACTTDAQYTFRIWETTGSIPRFNNSGTQVTVLLLQNPTDYSISGTVYLWTTAGAFVGSQAFTLAARAGLVLNTSAIAAGSSGTITVTQNGRFGDLQGKSVALEPSTGFSFDTPMTYRIH